MRTWEKRKKEEGLDAIRRGREKKTNGSVRAREKEGKGQEQEKKLIEYRRKRKG